MKRIISLLLISFCLVACVHISVNGGNDGNTGDNGNVKSFDVNVSAFHQIDVAGCANIIYDPNATSTYLRMEIDENLFSKIKVDVREGELEIRTKGNITPTTWNIYVGTPVLRDVELSGACVFNVKDSLSVAEMDFDIAGSTSLIFAKPVNMGKLSIDAAGSTKVQISGFVREGEFDCAGSGMLNAQQCNFDNVECDIAGSALVKLGEVKVLEYDVSGASKLTYKGNPSILESSISGAAIVTKD